MEIIWITFGTLFIFIGLIGSFLPVIPGLPFSYLGLIILQLTLAPFSATFMLVWLAIIILLMVLDNVLPTWGTKKLGGTPYGIWGSILGLLVGIFFPPIGFVLGPLIGAFVGEIIGGNNTDKALKSALGSFAGFMAATGMKVMAASVMAYYFFINALSAF
ncbi:MAG: DUF456 domain-containing protein [Balneolaceae bacterium]